MKRSLILGTIAVMTTGMLTACSVDNNGSDKVTKAQAAVSDQAVTESNEADKETKTTPTETSKASSTEAESDSSSTDSKSNKDIEDKITISDADKLTYSYTDISEIPLEKGTYIAVVAKGMDSSYWKMVKSGAEAAISDLNDVLGYTGKDKVRLTFEGPDNSTDIDAQINTIDTVLADNPSVLCLSAIDMTSCEPQLETAEDNGIPVVIIDSGIEKNDKVSLACETNNLEAGQEAAKHLSEAIGDEGEVTIISQVKLAQNSASRVEGFQDEITKNHPNVKVVSVNYEDEVDEKTGDAQKATDSIMDKLLKDNPDLKGVFYTNEGVGGRILTYLENHTDADVKLVGFDSGEKQQEAIKSGKLVGVISQNPYSMGYVSIVGAARLAINLPVDEYVNTSYRWVDKDNIDDTDVQQFLYK